MRCVHESFVGDLKLLDHWRAKKERAIKGSSSDVKSDLEATKIDLSLLSLKSRTVTELLLGEKVMKKAFNLQVFMVPKAGLEPAQA